MTTIGKMKAVSVLLRKDGVLGEDMHLPRVWVVDNDVALFAAAALRQQRNMFILKHVQLQIEEMTIDRAYQIAHGRELPISWKNGMVSWGFPQDGTTRPNETWYEWQRVMHSDNPLFTAIMNRK